MTNEEIEKLSKVYNTKGVKESVIKSLNAVLFKKPPPTPLEYLDPKNGWITEAFKESVYDYVKEDFVNILDRKKNYTRVVNYGATRTGKSFLSRMLIHYIIIFIHHLRNPPAFYGLSPNTNLSIYIMSFVTEKANQVLLKPVYDMLDMSPRFERVKFQDDVYKKQEEVGVDKIIWSKASTFGHLTLASKLSLNVGTDFMSFIGSDLLFLAVSELSFFIEKAGATHEEIFQIYSDGLERIKATVGHSYLGMIYLDTSANDVDNPIEKHIMELKNTKPNDVFFLQRSRWEARPYLFPKWQETGETFLFCKGNTSIQTKIIENKEELKFIPKDLVYEIPIDVKESFELNPIKSGKDILGVPMSKENKYIHNLDLINEIFSEPSLINIEGGLIADSQDNPDNVLFKQVVDKYFIKYDNKNLQFYRANRVPFYIGLDQAYSSKGDVYGFSLGHLESSKKGKMYVVDMSFPILPGNNGINLQAVENFILDLYFKGGVRIAKIFTDTFQSESLLQSLKRKGLEVEKSSVDRSVDAYLFFYTLLVQQQIKAGKNIFLKNNLACLEYMRNEKGNEKIDHPKGKTNNNYDGNFKGSTCGLFAKDVSDSVVQWVYNIRDETPYISYEDECKRLAVKSDGLEVEGILKDKLFGSMIKFNKNR